MDRHEVTSADGKGEEGGLLPSLPETADEAFLQAPALAPAPAPTLGWFKLRAVLWPLMVEGARAECSCASLSRPGLCGQLWREMREGVGRVLACPDDRLALGAQLSPFLSRGSLQSPSIVR